MHITFLGTGAGAAVNPQRGAASLLLAHDDSLTLLDSGPGFMERMAAASLDPDRVSNVILSHLHFDHALGIIDLFTRLIVRRGEPVTVFGPRDTDAYIEAALGFARLNSTRPQSLEWLDGVSVELTRPGDAREVGGVSVTSVEVPHAPYLECLARRFTAGGRSFVYTGDTIYAPDALVPLADGADLLIHEAFTEQALERTAAQLPERARDGFRRGMHSVHSPADAAAQIAAAAGVRTLVLTHLMPEERPAELIAAVREHYAGEVLIAQDGLSFSV